MLQQTTAKFALQLNKWPNKEPSFYLWVCFSEAEAILLCMEWSYFLEILGLETEREEESEWSN